MSNDTAPNVPGRAGYGADESLDDPVSSRSGEETPGEYESSEQSGGVSVDTGVTYDTEGEPESTPADAPVPAEGSPVNAATSGKVADQ